MAKQRRTKEQKRLDDLVSHVCQRCMSGYSIDIMKMHYLSDAGEAAAAAGKSDAEIEAAIIAARDEHAKPA